MKNNLDKFDTSNYEIDNIHNIPKNISVVGKMKDEFKGEVISQFVGTGAKAYCVQLGNNKTYKKAKGVKKCAIDKQLDITHYLSIVDAMKPVVTCSMHIFRSDHHTIFTDYLEKIALSQKDDKRFVIPHSTKTLAWGHKDIEQYTDSNLEETNETNSLDLLISLMREQVQNNNI